MTLQDAYALFGLQKGATWNEIEARYNDLARRWNPANAKPEESAKFDIMLRKVIEAYGIIKDDYGNDPNLEDPEVFEKLRFYRNYFSYIIEYHRQKQPLIINHRDIDNIYLDNNDNYVINISKLEKNIPTRMRGDIEELLFVREVTRVYYNNKSNYLPIVERDENKKTFTLKGKKSKRLNIEEITIEYDYKSELMHLETFEKIKYKKAPESLRKLFYDKNKVSWPSVPDHNQGVKWFILKDDKFKGVEEQRKFVKVALATLDYAFLDGPPGSGKTTVLAELVFQLMKKKQKILVTASTNVAIDNLLERIDREYETNNEVRKKLPDFKPLRLGKKNRVSKSVVKYTDPFPSKHKINKADLVCGTAEKIHNMPPDLQFDYMILDEASKTTLSEFLVPAVKAKRWIISGDIQQLVPYTDTNKISTAIEKLMHNLNLDEKNLYVVLDMFMALEDQSVCVLTNDDRRKNDYKERCKNMGIRFSDLDGSGGCIQQGVTVGRPESLSKIRPSSNIILRNDENFKLPSEWESLRDRRGATYFPGRTELERISGEIGLHLFKNLGISKSEKTGKMASKDSFKSTIHAGSAYAQDNIYSVFYYHLKKLQQVVMPSVLEIFQANPNALSKAGEINKMMSKEDFGPRHVLLKYQHRMHADIAEFSRKHIYKDTAMETPEDIKRDWEYDYEKRLRWIDVKGSDLTNSHPESNPKECEEIIKEIEKFSEFAKIHLSERPWQIAILPLYNYQKELLEKELAKEHEIDKDSGLFKPPVELKTPATAGLAARLAAYFRRPKPKKSDIPYTIKINTVDSFQGDEADIVFLSLTQRKPTPFLDNPNRINVAVTRARYLCIIVGNRGSMLQGDILKKLAEAAHPPVPNDDIGALFEAGRYGKVVDLCNDKLKTNKDDVEIQVWKVKALNKLGRYNKVVDFSKNLNNDIRILKQMGYAYKELKYYENAEECYKKIYEKNPDDLFVVSDYAYILNNREKHGETVKICEIARKTKSDLKIVKLLGDAYNYLEKYHDAEKCYKERLDKYPRDFNTLKSYAYILCKLNDFKKAEQYGERALKIASTESKRVSIEKMLRYIRRNRSD